MISFIGQQSSHLNIWTIPDEFGVKNLHFEFRKRHLAVKEPSGCHRTCFIETLHPSDNCHAPPPLPWWPHQWGGRSIRHATSNTRLVAISILIQLN